MMRKWIVPALLCAALCLPASHAGDEPSAKYVAHLSGQGENPPVDTRGQGQAKITVSSDELEVGYKLTVANTENMTQAHIHCGGPDVNGPVVVFLFGFVTGGVTLNGILMEGSFDNADVIPRPDSDLCPGGIGDLDDLLDAMENGMAYVNVHTVANPPGEIRGQLQPAD